MTATPGQGTPSEYLLRAAEALRTTSSRAVEGPWEVTDGEGELAVSAGRARPTWNEAMTGYSDAGSYPPEARIVEHSLDTWDREQDGQDDAQRDNAHWIALVGPEVGPHLAHLLAAVDAYSLRMPGAVCEAADKVAAAVLANDERNSRAY